MHPRDARDGRGQTEMVGAILMFGLLIALLVVLQLGAVPASNARVEFEHSLHAQASIQELGGAALDTGVHDTESVVTVEYGTRYPSRLLLRSPPPAPGSLRTVDLGPVVLRNAVADGEAFDYLNGTTLTFDSRAIEYQPAYTEYREAPVTTFEYPVTYNRFATADRVLDGGSLVAGDRLTLLLLEGEFARSQVSPGPVHLVPVSAATRPIAVTNPGDDPLTLELPTRLSNETWANVLAGEYVSAGGHVAAQRYVEGADGDPSTLILELETGRSYRLSIARVAVEDAPSSPEPAHYLVEGEGNHSNVRLGEEQVLSVEVRDRYNNPVSGVPVVADPAQLGNVTARGGGETAFSDESGRAWFTYRAPETGVTGVETTSFDVVVDGKSDATARVPFTIELRGSKSGGDGSGGDGGTGTEDSLPTFTRLSVTADDVDSSQPTVEQVTLEYDTTAALPVYEVVVRVDHRPAFGAPRTVATRENLPGSGNETIGLLVHGQSDTNSWAINGQPDLEVTVTAVDTVGNTVACIGIVESPDETVTLTTASDGGVPFACTTSAADGGE